MDFSPVTSVSKSQHNKVLCAFGRRVGLGAGILYGFVAFSVSKMARIRRKRIYLLTLKSIYYR